MKKIKKNWPTIVLLGLIIGCVFVLNISTLRSPDDYSYAYTIAGQDLKIESLDFFSPLKDADHYADGRELLVQKMYDEYVFKLIGIILYRQ